MTRAEPWTEQDYVVVDVEGNGARPPELVELTVVPIERGVIGSASTWLVRPPAPISDRARRIHGITDADVASAPPAAEVEAEIRTGSVTRSSSDTRCTSTSRCCAGLFTAGCRPAPSTHFDSRAIYSTWRPTH